MLERSALLLLGPTGSGKTPLGALLEQRGLAARPCAHFDFGEHLRRSAQQPAVDDGFLQIERDFIRGVLTRGALLEDEHFTIAERILTRFLARRAAAPGCLVVLNGLPRHAGQAMAVSRLVPIEAVVWLDCPAEVVQSRIARDSGGDRSGRTDDSLDAVRRRLETFSQRTAPLISLFREQGAAILCIEVTERMTAAEMLEKIVGLYHECLVRPPRTANTRAGLSETGDTSRRRVNLRELSPGIGEALPPGVRSMTRIGEGDSAPDVVLMTHRGDSFRLHDFQGRSPVVVFFYPRDGSPVCTAEVCAFRDSFEKFAEAGVAVFGVSSDSVERHRSFATEHGLPFYLVADEGDRLRTAFGVPRTGGLLPGRVTYVIDKQGIVCRVFNAQLAAARHVDQALAALGLSR